MADFTIHPVVNNNEIIEQPVRRSFISFYDNVYDVSKLIALLEPLRAEQDSLVEFVTEDQTNVFLDFLNSVTDVIEFDVIERPTYRVSGRELFDNPSEFVVLSNPTNKTVSKQDALAVTINQNQSYIVQRKSDIPTIVPKVRPGTVEQSFGVPDINFNHIEYRTCLQLLGINDEELLDTIPNEIISIDQLFSDSVSNSIISKQDNTDRVRQFGFISKTFTLDVNTSAVDSDSVSWDVTPLSSTKKGLPDGVYTEQDPDNPFVLRIKGWPVEDGSFGYNVVAAYQETFSNNSQQVQTEKTQTITDTLTVLSYGQIVLRTNIRLDNIFTTAFNKETSTWRFLGEIPRVQILAEQHRSTPFRTTYTIRERTSLPDFVEINVNTGDVVVNNTSYKQFLEHLGGEQQLPFLNNPLEFHVECKQDLELPNGTRVVRRKEVACFLRLSRNEVSIDENQDTEYQGTLGLELEQLKTQTGVITDPIPVEETDLNVFPVLWGTPNNEVTTMQHIRDLENSVTDPTTGTKTFNVPSGSRTFVLAVPTTGFIGPNAQLNTIEQIIVDSEFNIDISGIFETKVINVTGESQFESKVYTVYQYTPIEPYPTDVTYEATFN